LNTLQKDGVQGSPARTLHGECEKGSGSNCRRSRALDGPNAATATIAIKGKSMRRNMTVTFATHPAALK
jgi:hypothetical protein